MRPLVVSTAVMTPLRIVHRPMMVIGRMTAVSAFAHQARVGIGGADCHVVDRLKTRPVRRIIELLCLRLVSRGLGRDQLPVNS